MEFYHFSFHLRICNFNYLHFDFYRRQKTKKFHWKYQKNVRMHTPCMNQKRKKKKKRNTQLKLNRVEWFDIQKGDDWIIYISNYKWAHSFRAQELYQKHFKQQQWQRQSKKFTRKKKTFFYAKIIESALCFV